MRRWRIFLAMLGSILWVETSSGQSLVPLGIDTDEPLRSTGISPSDVMIEASHVAVWQNERGEHVIHAIGGFDLTLGGRRLSADEAVIWMHPEGEGDDAHRHFEVFMLGRASIIELAGTVTEGPVLFVTLNSSGGVRTQADHVVQASNAESPAVQEAQRVRAEMAAEVTEEEGAAPDVGPSRPVEKPEARGRNVRVEFGEFLGGEGVYTVTGNVRVIAEDVASGDYLVLQGDSAVLFRDVDETPASGDEVGRQRDTSVSDEDDDVDGRRVKPDGDGLTLQPGRGGLNERSFAGTELTGVYLEGDVRISVGDRSIRSSRLYYDLANDRAIILDAVLRTPLPRRDVPLYLRADEIRQLSQSSYTADHARLTTSEFHTPHYHIGAEHIEVEERSVGGVEPSSTWQAAAFKMQHTTFNIGGVPVLYWPYAQGEFDTGEPVLRSVRAGFSDRFGAELETRWRLFSVLGLPAPKGVDGTLGLDVFGDRGPGIGIDVEYEQDYSFGLVRGYYIHDDDRDHLPGFFDNEPDSKHRGRLTWRHRQYLEDDWQLTLEGSYISDSGFLEEYFEKEFDDDKDQETLIYLKKQRDNWAFTALAQWRVLDFFTQTEHLPDFSFRLIGEPISDVATLFSENRIGFVRYRPADQTLLEKIVLGANPDGSGTTGRADSRQEVEFPFDVGPVRMVAFGSIRGSAWDDSPADGGVGRAFGTYGLRGSMFLSRVYPEIESDLLDIHGVRHIIKPDFVVWGSHTNLDSDKLYPFETGVETIDEVDGVTVGVRQRWQTKRGGEKGIRTVDVLTLDIEAGAFNDASGKARTNGFTSYSRPEESLARNYVNSSAIWRLNDATALVSEVNYDMNDGEIDIFNVSYVVERDPRLSYLIGYRLLEEADANLLAFGANYRLTEKHTLAFREEFDVGRGETLEFSIGYIRKLPRWYVSVEFDLDRADEDFGVSLSAWPEGLPSMALGSRRYTGLAESMRIQSE